MKKKTIKELIEEGTKTLHRKGIESPRLDAEVLLDSVLKCGRITFYSHPDRLIDENKVKEYVDKINRRGAFEPVAYITGQKEFMGFSFKVTHDVLIPRPDTEPIIEAIIGTVIPSLFGNDRSSLCVLDLCTGSGAIGLSLKKNRNDIKITLSDISKTALNVARENAQRLEIDDAVFIQSDLYNDFPVDVHYDLIVSNPPYIPDEIIKTLQKDIVDYEPYLALSGGESGYEIYECIARDSGSLLNNQGIIVLEVGDGQAEHVENLLENQGFSIIQEIPDLTGMIRGVIARKDSFEKI
ncbi:MAG: peptide chain release factor N(5)-glutamine methyltransferase [Eubacterium sp.]